MWGSAEAQLARVPLFPLRHLRLHLLTARGCAGGFLGPKKRTVSGPKNRPGKTRCLISFLRKAAFAGPFLGPENGPKNGPASDARFHGKLESLLGFSYAQVLGVWNWSEWLRGRAAAIGREPLFLDMDETAVVQASPDAIGMVVRKRWWQSRCRPVQKVPKSKHRGMTTHAGLVTHNARMQGRLPQIFVGNRK